jgi:radical SAM protein (TIGR01212 family)
MNRYRDLNTYLRTLFGERVQKIALDAGLNCPNRDGTLSHEGCAFCNGLGSGTGALTRRNISIEQQIREARDALARLYGARKFIAYFQSYTNTYASPSFLRTLYDRALVDDDIVGLAVATRPDCVDEEILDVLRSYQPGHLVWMELGLQSAHDATLRRVNRGHDVRCFEQTVLKAAIFGLDICAHVILGLPGETPKMMMETARFISQLPITGVKIHLLYVVAGTPLAALYQKGVYRCLGKEEYVELVVDFLERLPSHVIIHRLTSDPARSELLAPSWALHKSDTLNRIRECLERRDTWQGKRCGGSSGDMHSSFPDMDFV